MPSWWSCGPISGAMMAFTSTQSLHLSVHDGNGLYWMELAVRADTTLRQLDDFLRGMWLECCGHLSEFTIQGTRYSNLTPHPDDPNAAAIRADYWMDDDEEHMDIAVADVMPEGVEVSYEYDYGSATELFLENLGRHGDLVGLLRPHQPWHGDRISVLARNEPDEECVACQGPARWRLLSPDTEARAPIPFCDGCRPEARTLPAGDELTPGRNRLLRQRDVLGRNPHR